MGGQTENKIILIKNNKIHMFCFRILEKQVQKTRKGAEIRKISQRNDLMLFHIKKSKKKLPNTIYNLTYLPLRTKE